MSVSRRDFTRFLAVGGSAAFLPEFPKGFTFPTGPLPKLGLAEPDEKFWNAVRARYLVPKDLAFINSANVAPACLPVVEVLEKNTRFMEANPSAATRAVLTEGREESRRLLAQSLGVKAEEIVMVRNTSEANNFVSSGLKLGAGDEVLIFGDNHPSNLNAWREKSKRFGFTVVEVPATLPHPGTDFYVEAFSKAFTPRTKLLSITHVTNTTGDMLPVKELCALAHSRGALAHVDGAQTFGIIENNLRDMGADFYTGSAHKWLCGPKEIGLLFVAESAQDRISPSVVGLYPGAVGISKTMEGFGQRDEAALATLGAAVKFQTEIGRANIEKRSRGLARRAVAGLSKINGITFYSSTDPSRYAAIITFKVGSLDPDKLVTTLYEKEKIVVAHTSAKIPGLRLSPHLCNTTDEVDRAVVAIAKYMKNGLPA